MLSVISGFAADIVAAIGATFVTNATTQIECQIRCYKRRGYCLTWYFVKVSFQENQPTKVSSANLSCPFPLVFYQQQDFRKGAAPSIS
jgi:hypothetical protein